MAPQTRRVGSQGICSAPPAAQVHEENDEVQQQEDCADGEENNFEIETEGLGNDNNPTLQKRRGGTFLPKVYGRPSHIERPKVIFDKRGQPVGKNRKEFTSFLVTLARNGQQVPLDIKDWRHMPSDRLNEILAIVKKHFVVPRGSEGWILQSVGKKWRSFKSRCKTKCYNQSRTIDAQMVNKDARISEDQWKKLIDYWGTDEAKAKSAKNKEIRDKKTMDHACGQKPFAQVAQDMKEELGRSPSCAELFKECYTNKSGEASSSKVASTIGEMESRSSQLPPGSQDEVGPNDIFSQAMGEERNGRVRMLGLGVTPTDEFKRVPSKNVPFRVYMEQQQVLEKMNERLERQDERFHQQEERFSQLLSLLQQRNSPPNNISRMPSSSSNELLPRSMNGTLPLEVNASILLKSVADQKTIVAKGYIVSLDQTKHVNGHRLGVNWCEVSVQHILQPDEPLMRPFARKSIIGDTLGLSIAWPCSLVFREDEE